MLLLSVASRPFSRHWVLGSRDLTRYDALKFILLIGSLARNKPVVRSICPKHSGLFACSSCESSHFEYDNITQQKQWKQLFIFDLIPAILLE